MLVRIIVGVVCAPLLLAVLFLCPPRALPCLYALLSMLAQHELLWATGLVKNRLVVALAACAAGTVPFLLYFDCPAAAYIGLLLALVIAFFLIAMNTGRTLGFPQLAAALFSALVVPLFLSLVIEIRNGENGLYLLVLPCLAAWMSDTGAYFTGTFLGRHKLCPNISPKKSVEGAVGGVLGALVGGAVYALIMVMADFTRSICCGSAGICGGASTVWRPDFFLYQREFGIKDYGRLFPGHGGVLDRFDSIFLTTPVTAVLLALLPAILQ